MKPIHLPGNFESHNNLEFNQLNSLSFCDRNFPLSCRLWHPSYQHPYPMNFVDAPSPEHQIYVYYQGRPMLQGLSRTSGPIMYPLTHSIPDPYQLSFIALARRC